MYDYKEDLGKDGHGEIRGDPLLLLAFLESLLWTELFNIRLSRQLLQSFGYAKFYDYSLLCIYVECESCVNGGNGRCCTVVRTFHTIASFQSRNNRASLGNLMVSEKDPILSRESRRRHANALEWATPGIVNRLLDD